MILDMKEENRSQRIWVNDFTVDQANKYLDNFGMLMGDEELRKRVFANVGTGVKKLQKLRAALEPAMAADADVGDGSSNEHVTEAVEAFIAKEYKAAVRAIKAHW